MEKEILTTEIIQKELQKYYAKNLWMFLVALPFYAFMVVCLAFFTILFINVILPNKEALKIIGIVMCTILGLLYLYEFCNAVKDAIRIRKGNFQVTNDWVVDKLPQIRTRRRYRPYTLVFARSGKYGIPDTLNYKWSNLYNMYEDAVYRMSDLDDDFYVIRVGNKNLLAYSKKMFELK
ncbi:MAG: hypothetical protein IKV81_00595 [Clostridia bacterium]|nr:hypothetical protein [Clostridia bacterium]